MSMSCDLIYTKQYTNARTLDPTLVNYTRFGLAKSHPYYY